MRAEWRGVGSVRTCTVATNALVLAQKLPPSSLSFPRVLVAFEVAVGSTTPRVGGLWARRKRTEGNASPAHPAANCGSRSGRTRLRITSGSVCACPTVTLAIS
jgi:hypothetical protein